MQQTARDCAHVGCGMRAQCLLELQKAHARLNRECLQYEMFKGINLGQRSGCLHVGQHPEPRGQLALALDEVCLEYEAQGQTG